jgi:cell division protein FtsB
MSRNRWILLGVIVLLIIFLPGYIKYQELNAKNRLLLKNIDELRRENVALSRQVEKLEKDPLYIEKKARNKIGIGKKGEIRYKVVDGTNK